MPSHPAPRPRRSVPASTKRIENILLAVSLALLISAAASVLWMPVGKTVLFPLATALFGAGAGLCVVAVVILQVREETDGERQ